MFFSYTEHFSATYASARQKFVDAAHAAGAALASYPYPGSRGIDGEALSIDVAQLGDAASPRQLVMISATHGTGQVPYGSGSRLRGVVTTTVPSAPVRPRSAPVVATAAPASGPCVARSLAHNRVFVSETTR